MKVTAKLNNWTRHQVKDGVVYVGNVEGDLKGRFSDGTMITTSRVKGVEKTIEGLVIAHTLNSSYLLGKPCEAV